LIGRLTESLTGTVSAVLLILAFPSGNLTFLAPFALIPLLYYLDREPSPWRRIRIGYATGFIYWFGVCYWIQFTLANHGGTGEAGGWALFVLFCLAKAIQTALFTWLAGVVMPTRWAVPSIAALWTIFEWTHQYTGFTWLLLGNATIDWPILPRLAPWTGVYGLSFLLALAAAAIVKRQWAWLALAIVPALLPALPAPHQGAQTVLAVQPNLPEEEAWTPESVRKMDQHLAEISTPQHPVAFVVWPEVPAPIYDTDRILPEIARATHTAFLAGVVSRTPDGDPLNSAVLFSSEGAFVSKYDKVNLVPFGEFVPWPFTAVTRKISSEAGDYRAGTKVVVADRIGTFICYESVFPAYIRRFARDGAEVLFNLSNDGWFGKSSARFQHFEIARMRAVENRRWIVRVTNNGITASIDPAGRVSEMKESYREVVGDLHFDYIREMTFYSRHGDWFIAACALLLAPSAFIGVYRRPRSSLQS
jgi:apolipoprotein N-acyltransferase